MSKKTQPLESSKGSFGVYITGFILSLILTTVAYLLVQRYLNTGHLGISRNLLIFMITGLASIQLLVQLIFFLHLDTESKPRWNLTVLLFAALVLVIVVFGSLWIMNNLNYHMEDNQDEINKYIRSQHDL